MSRQYKTATVFGGTGFVGTQVVRELAKRDVIVKVATRVPERAYFLRPCGTVGQIVPFACDYNDPDSIAKAVKGSDYVINCIGVLYERGKKTFKHAHVDIPAAIAKACVQEEVTSFVHVSALSADKGTSKYAKSKLAGEEAVLENAPQSVILRPSIIFGEDDDFFNRFAKMASVLPVLPLINDGATRFQPVFVGDVADAIITALKTPSVQGKIFELGGPEVVNFKGLFERMLSFTHQKVLMMPLSFGLAKFQSVFLSLLPTPLLTWDQVESLKTDNVVSDGALGLRDLDVQPTSLDVILPHYLERYRPGGRFGDKNASTVEG